MIAAMAQVHAMHPIRWTVPEKVTSLVMARPLDAMAQVHVTHPTRQAMPEKETFLAMARSMGCEMGHRIALPIRLGMAQVSAHEMMLRMITPISSVMWTNDEKML
jgi:hypothetical protein